FAEAPVGLEMKSDQLREQAEHPRCATVPEVPGMWIDGTKRAKHLSIGQDDRHRNIALEAISRGGVVTAINGILGDIVDDDLFPQSPDLIANCRLEGELATMLQTEVNIVENLAGDR